MKKHFSSLAFYFAVITACLLLLTRNLHAHGYAGERFFPATLTTDDPFVADELSLPTFSTIVTPDGGGTRETEFSIDIAKEIFPHFGVEIGESMITTKTVGEKAQTGLGNMEIGAKYQFVTNAKHELIVSAGFDAEIGGTGTLRAGADSFSTWTPTLYFGKGMGDLPNCVSFLKPFAVTGTIGMALPSRGYNQSIDVEGGEGELDVEANSDTMQYGFALQYSLIYLQQHVKDLGIREPFNRLIPLVEFNFEQPLDRGNQGLVTGTINPGILWSGKSFQLGIEAIIPMNSRTGNNVGVIAQVHFYLDDLLPAVFGHPIFGGKQ
ncbi:MAG: hypothetical protein ABI443_05530 [Chthoniobacterales bacterium]